MEILTTAIGHEMAHIARRDFLCNLCYEAVALPVWFHPTTLWLRREIDRTRELACDELVTELLLEPAAYAESIVSDRGGNLGVRQPGYTLGVLDGDILEERIRRLLHRAAGESEARAADAGHRVCGAGYVPCGCVEPGDFGAGAIRGTAGDETGGAGL